MVVPFVSPTYWSVLPVLGLAFPVLVVACIVLALIWLTISKRRAILPLLMVVIALAFMPRYINFGAVSIAPDTFTIATYNLSNALAGYDRQKEKRASKRERLEDFLHQLRPIDIVCVQERGAFAAEVLAAVFNEHYTHSHKGKGAAILSRFPIVDQGIIDFGTVTNSCLWADLRVGDGIVRVYSTHFQSNMITMDTKRILDGEAPAKQGRGFRVRRVFKNFVANHLIRLDQGKLVKQHIASSPYPVLLCGDFNDVPMSRLYQSFADILDDSFIDRGAGLATTFAGHIPFLRIDYIWLSKTLEAHSHKVVKGSGFSDHNPVVVEVGI
jgi:endonuclease/exonuclease/phosphatase family metal-dependent hydrolase